MNNYKYNFNIDNLAVYKRTKRAVGFAHCMMSRSKEVELSQMYLNRVFGSQNHPLSNYLRRTLLKTTNDRFIFGVSSKCKMYAINPVGVERLMSAMKSSRHHTIKDVVITNNSYCSINDKLALAVEFAVSEFGDDLNSQTFNYKDKAGRLWHPMQNVKKEVKRPLLASAGLCYEYDIECCAPTLLLQYAKQHGVKKTPTVDAYIIDRTTERNRIAEELEIDVKDAKQIITSLFSGAQISKSIAGVLLHDTAKVEWLKQDEFIVELKKDIAKIWQALKPVVDYRNESSKKLSSRIKWGVYFSLERKVLDVVRTHLCDTNNKHFLEHDGWTASKQMNVEDVIQMIKEKTSFEVMIEERVNEGTEIIACF